MPNRMQILKLCMFLLLVVGLSAQSLPDYTSQNQFSFNISYDYTTLMSPDDTSMIYYMPNDQQLSKSFIFIPSIFQQQMRIINVTQKIQYMNFGGKGRVYLVSRGYQEGLLVFTIYYMNINDGEVYPFLGTLCKFNTTKSIPTISRMEVSLYKIAIGADTQLIILQMYQYNTVAYLQRIINMTLYNDSYIRDMVWHPVDRQNLFVAGRNKLFMYQGNNRDFNAVVDADSYGVGILLNGQIIAQYCWPSINLYQYNAGKLTALNMSAQNFITDSSLFSRKGGIFVGQKSNGNILQLKVYEVTKVQSVKRNTFQQEQSRLDEQNEITYELKMISQKNISQQKFFAITSDGNEYYTYSYYYKNKLFQQRLRCRDNTYQVNGTCQNCSSQCRSCHRSATQCTRCAGSDTVYTYEKCDMCNVTYLGCQKCNNTDCSYCSKDNNFNLKPVNNKCSCTNASYPIEDGKRCRNCSDVLVGCAACDGQYSCKECANRFVLNGSYCKCQANYSLKDNKTCQLCDSYIKNCTSCTWNDGTTLCQKCIKGYYPTVDTKGCIDCWRISIGCIGCTDVCFKCDTSRFYNNTIVNGRCVCNYGYVEQNETCVPCQAKGCSTCLRPQSCTKCFSEKKFNPYPVNGACTCQNNTLPNENNTQCFSCNDKMIGCINCATLTSCTECNSSKNFILNQNKTGCTCRKDHFLFKGQCKLCNEIFPYCSSCVDGSGYVICFECNKGFTKTDGECVCMQGYDITDEQTCEKSNLVVFLAFGGVMLVLVGFLVYTIVRYCKKRSQYKKALAQNLHQDIVTPDKNGNSQSLLSG